MSNKATINEKRFIGADGVNRVPIYEKVKAGIFDELPISKKPIRKQGSPEMNVHVCYASSKHPCYREY